MKWLYRKRNSLDVRLLYGAAGREGVRKFGPYSPRTQHRIGVILKRYNPETSKFKLFLIDYGIPMIMGFICGQWLYNHLGPGYALLLCFPSAAILGGIYGLTLGRWLKGTP